MPEKSRQNGALPALKGKCGEGRAGTEDTGLLSLYLQFSIQNLTVNIPVSGRLVEFLYKM